MEESGAKWKGIAESLGSKIRSGEWLPGFRVPNEADLAKEWGVSRPTAHRALSELQREGLVSRQRRHGTVVADRAAKETHLVALVFDHFAKAFDFPQADLIHGIQEVLGERYSIVWCDSMDDPQREANFLQRMSKETDGIICFPIADPVNTPLMHSLHRHTVPLVLLDRVPEGFDGSAVISEDRETTRESIRYLGNKGHKNIAFLGFYKPTVSSARARFEGYLDGMKDIGVEDPSPYCRWFVRQLEHEPDLFCQAVQDCMCALLNKSPKVTAVYCIQDSFAAEVTRCCEHFGLTIPNELEVIVVNEWPKHLLKEAANMHRIVRRKRDIGVAAAERLLQIRAGTPFEPTVLRIPAELHTGGAEEIIRAPGYLGATRPMEVNL